MRKMIYFLGFTLLSSPVFANECKLAVVTKGGMCSNHLKDRNYQKIKHIMANKGYTIVEDTNSEAAPYRLRVKTFFESCGWDVPDQISWFQSVFQNGAQFSLEFTGPGFRTYRQDPIASKTQFTLGAGSRAAQRLYRAVRELEDCPAE